MVGMKNLLHLSLTRPALAGLALAALLIGGCTPTVDLRGNLPEPDQMAQIKEGVSTRDDVQALLGTPSATSTFGDESWQYISSRTETVAFFAPEEKDRKVVRITFDRNGVVKKVSQLGLQDAKDIDQVSRETPTAGKELSILEQLLGNVGRFSKDAAGNGK